MSVKLLTLPCCSFGTKPLAPQYKTGPFILSMLVVTSVLICFGCVMGHHKKGKGSTKKHAANMDTSSELVSAGGGKLVI